MLDVERRESKPIIQGKFEGSVSATWVKLQDNGSGIVNYNQKEYVTRPIGFTSIPAGSNVLLTFANGVYYSSW